MRASTGSDAPRVEQPRAGTPDGRPEGEGRPSGDRPRASDVRGDGTAARPGSRTGVADGSPRGTDHRSALQSGSRGEPASRAGVDDAAVRQTADSPQSRREGDGPSPLDAAGLLPLAAVPGTDASPRADRTAHPEPVAGTDDDHATTRPDPQDTEQPRDCAIRSLELIRQATGSDVIEVPTREVGLDGVSQSEIEQAAGVPLRDVGNHNDIRDALMYETGPDGSLVLDSDGHPIERPDGVAALVVDIYGKTDEHNVGAHAYVLLKENGEVVVHDPTAGLRHDFPPRLPSSDYPVQVTRTILFDENGIPHQHEGVEVPEPALRNVDVGQRPPDAAGGPVEPASGSDGGARQPPGEPPRPASPGDPGGESSNNNRDNESGESPALEPDSISLADETKPFTVDIEGERIPLALEPDGENHWRAVPAEEGEPPARPEGSGEVEKKSPLRSAWERIRDKTYVRGYEGITPSTRLDRVRMAAGRRHCAMGSPTHRIC